MLTDELIALLELVRSAEQALHVHGANHESTVRQFERANERKQALILKLRSIDETR